MLFVFFELKKWAIKNDYLKIIILEKNTRALLSMFNPTHQRVKAIVEKTTSHFLFSEGDNGPSTSFNLFFFCGRAKSNTGKTQSSSILPATPLAAVMRVTQLTLMADMVSQVTTIRIWFR